YCSVLPSPSTSLPYTSLFRSFRHGTLLSSLRCEGLGGGFRQFLGARRGGERLQTGDQCDVDDVGDARPAGQVVDRGGQTLQQGTECVGSAEALGDLVADVAGREVGEDEHVRMAG